MKKLIAVLLSLCLMLAGCALAESELLEDWTIPDDADALVEDSAATAGGWEITNVTTAKLDKALKAAFEKAVSELAGVIYTPVGVLATQVVSGTNTCILCHCAYVASDDGDTGWSLVYLYQPLGGDAEVTNVVNLDVAALSDYGIFS